MANWTLSVSDLNEYVRRSLAADPILRMIRLRGEISGFKLHVSGHWYFTLKDEHSRINCVMFRQSAQQVSFRPADGMRVVLEGTVGLYTASGMYQFYAEGMEQDGVGELYRKLEELKQKLMREGLFDASRKRPLPLFPRKVGIVTARTGAVVHDIATVSRRRHPGVQLVLRPAQVQGEGAAQDIARGIEEIALCPGVDVIIVGRGGGSVEDLWAFNEEIVVRAVAACPVPVISAVGHEVDTTLCDYAADVRAATPSAAAELAVPEKAVLEETLSAMRNDLERAMRGTLMTKRDQLLRRENRLAALHPLTQLQKQRQKALALTMRMETGLQKRMLLTKSKLTELESKLDVLGPKQALRRGYAMVLSNGRAVTKVGDMPLEAELVLGDGRVLVRTLEKKEGDPFAAQKENG
ncbi:MAG: exodeoxyribonuclease VII large subunit [Clostridia bacterium]|nr:exodeoxyribonuclease VII large subunit [Clostridia bacterium]